MKCVMTTKTGTVSAAECNSCKKCGPSAGSAGSLVYSAKANTHDPGRVLVQVGNTEHGMEWFEAQTFAARIMDAVAIAVKLKNQ